jgi:methylenetetrahydrofolate--tRNA-(uracil-5-)-methyltransferase
VRAIPPEGFVVLATGPLTSPPLDRAIGELLGTEDLYFYDSIAPVVSADSLDFSRMYAMSRYGKGGGADYWNCPMTAPEYEGFVDALRTGETVPVKDFEKGIYFEGCLPIEVMAERGRETLRHGPLKPMGLADPRTGRIPHAVVQLRQDDLAREHYNLVGFQTKLKIGEQQRIFRTIAGLENAIFVRYGMLHRNTYIHAPAHLDRFWRMRREPRIFFAGQITGVEGYVESAATGLAVGLTIAQLHDGREPEPIPYTTAIGSLARHCSERSPQERFEPMNVTFGLIEDTSHSPIKDKTRRRQMMVDRALAAIRDWRDSIAAAPIEVGS